MAQATEFYSAFIVFFVSKIAKQERPRHRCSVAEQSLPIQQQETVG